MRKIPKKALLSRLAVLLYSVLMTINVGCSGNEKDEYKAVIDFEATEIINVTQSSATINADLKSSGSESILFRGICIAMQTNPTVNDIKYEEQGNVLGQYTAKFENLQYNTKYYARPYIKTNSTTIYGSELTFTTKSISVPILTTKDVSGITQNSAIFSGKIENDGSSKILSKGFFYSKTNTNPEVKDQKVESTGDFEFFSSVNGLEANTTYYVRAYAINAAGVAYGETIWVKTIGGDKPTVVASGGVNGLTAYATVTVTKQGSDNITAINVKCFDMDGNSVGKVVSGGGWSNNNIYAPVTFEISGLSRNKKYYIIGYATNGVGTGASERVYVTTL